jgi:hypothetical protein
MWQSENVAYMSARFFRRKQKPIDCKTLSRLRRVSLRLDSLPKIASIRAPGDRTEAVERFFKRAEPLELCPGRN